jgi:hypothetical protein
MSPIFMTIRNGPARRTPMMPILHEWRAEPAVQFGRACINQAIRRIPEEMPSCAGWKVKPARVKRWTASPCCMAIAISTRLTT